MNNALSMIGEWLGTFLLRYLLLIGDEANTFDDDEHVYHLALEYIRK